MVGVAANIFERSEHDAEQQKRLISGFGLGVGSAAIAGALGVILSEAAPNLEKSLLLRPFPHEPPAGLDMATFQNRYRDGMIQQAGLCVFIGGFKEGSGGKSVIANGVLEEFESAKRLGRIVVPIGATGGAAAKIWDRIRKSGVSPASLTKAEFDRLGDPGQSPSDLANIVQKAIKAL
jgi:Sir2- and TIR-associating SLOG family